MLYMNTLILVAVLYHNNHMIAQEEYCYTVNTLSCLHLIIPMYVVFVNVS